MSTGASIFSLAAAALYALVAISAMAACVTASRAGQPRWNRNVWAGLAVLFVILILLRLLGVEDALREALREALRSGGTYDARRSLQGMIASIVIITVALISGWWIFRISRTLRGRRNVATIAALVAGGAMLILVALRMISLHMIDRALYGALKLNWIGDIGTSVVVLAAAIYYVRLVRARP